MYRVAGVGSGLIQAVPIWRDIRGSGDGNMESIKEFLGLLGRTLRRGKDMGCE